MEALVYTFLLVSTLGIIFFAIFFENLLKFQLKNKMIFHYLN
uniref:Photosystem II protein T n=1 Tax=Galium odoratum TaxID=35899 RepID=A0A2K9RNA7_GALOD|nr:photosystem II protein T [Galium odoratum]